MKGTLRRARSIPNRCALPLMLAALALGALALGCPHGDSETTAPEKNGVETAGGSVRGDWLRRAESADPQTLNFVRCQDRLGKLLAELISDTLVQYNKDLEIVPRLAESWTFSPDHRLLTFRLRPGVRWHDGAPVSSADVVYTIERIRDPSSLARNKLALFEPIEKIEAPDARTVSVTYRQPYSAALDAWTDAALIPRHLYEKEANFLDNPQCTAPIGCGPFRFVSWKHDQELVLEANDDYWDGRPYVDGIIIKIMPADSTRLQALRLGEIDELSMSPEQFVVQARGPEFDSRLRSLSYAVNYLWYIGWNMDGSNPFFTDRRVRQAMTYALNRPELIKTIWHDRALAAASSIPPESWAYAPEVRPYPFDPRKASDLLTEAGWIDRDGDGVREKNGVPFSFSLLYASTGKTNDDIAAFFQENLRKVGVRVVLSKTEFKTFLDWTGNGRFQAMMSGYQLDVDPDPYDMFHSSQAKTGINHTSYSNPEVDRLCEQGRVEFDRQKRRQLYAAVQRILSEDQPCTFVFHPLASQMVDRRFRGVQTSRLGLYLFWPGVSRWWVPAQQQRFRQRGS